MHTAVVGAEATALPCALVLRRALVSPVGRVEPGQEQLTKGPGVNEAQVSGPLNDNTAWVWGATGSLGRAGEQLPAHAEMANQDLTVVPLEEEVLAVAADASELASLEHG